MAAIRLTRKIGGLRGPALQESGGEDNAVTKTGAKAGGEDKAATRKTAGLNEPDAGMA
jgi:hypothetical protein